MTTWFTADRHFGHVNVIGFCRRPFPNVATMDARMLAELCGRMQQDDDLWVIGDFAANKAGPAQRAEIKAIFDTIPGRKHLVQGSHDGPWIRELGWKSIAQMPDTIVEEHSLFLCHYPMFTFPDARRGSLQLFGHVHQNWAGTRNSINVGVEMWEFRPVRLHEILERAARLPINQHWDEVEPGCPLASDAGA